MILWYYKSIIWSSRASFISTPLIVSPFTLANLRVNFSCNFRTLLLQSVVGSHLALEMVLLSHTKTQLRELRYSSDVTQGLSQLGG